MHFLAADLNNPLETLPERLSLSSRTSDYAMANPVKANQPISSSFNVMGPHPLMYPLNFSESENSGNVNLSAGNDSREAQVQTEVVLGPSTSSAEAAPVRKVKKFRYDYPKNERSTEMQDRPQDLSFSRDVPEPLLNANNDVDMAQEGEGATGSSSVISPNLLVTMGLEHGQVSSRPQIIVSPKKAALEFLKQNFNNLSVLSGVHTEYNTHNNIEAAPGVTTPTSSSSRSPNKSVIVRAGSSNVSLNNY